MAKEEKHEVKRIEGIEAKKQTKYTARRFVETFIQEDVTDVGDYVLWDVVLPGIRTAIGDIWASIGDGLFGTSSRKNHVEITGKLNNRTYVNYSKLTNKVSNDSRIERRSIYEYDEVKACYLISAEDFDYMVILEGKTMRQVANFVSSKLSTIEFVTGTATHFIMKKYKENATILGAKKVDTREKVSP